MNKREFFHIIAAMLILTTVSGLLFAFRGQWNLLAQAFLFSVIIILVSVFSKKLVASLLDADVEHEIWFVQWLGFTPVFKLKKPVPAGIILPLFLSLFSAGIVKFSSLLTYETKALKRRASKRLGFYSFTEMTDFHNGLIGAGGIVAVLILAIAAYLIPENLELLAKLSVYYAFWNILPLSKLDGTQIFFGSRVIWATLAIITTILTAFAMTIT
jgi:hypothetical protein